MVEFMGRDNDSSVESAERVRTARAGCSGKTEATGPSVVPRPSYAALQDHVDALEDALRGLLAVYAPTARNRAAKERALAVLGSTLSGAPKP